MYLKPVLFYYRRFIFFFLTALSLSVFAIAQNPIVTENSLSGNPPSEWDIVGAGDLTIQGFATDISVNRGQTIRFKIKVNDATSYTIKIYRIGYYQGNGARLVASLGPFSGINQPTPITSSDGTGLVDCSNWTISASWGVPVASVTGVYIAKLTRTVGGGSSHIIFIVRDDAGTSDLLFKTSDATWQAYNGYGGNSLYVGTTSFPSGHAAKVSYNRPFLTRSGGGGGGSNQDWFFSNEYPMIRFLERNGYNVSYATDVDMERNTTPFTPSKRKILLSVGHDEYWSAGTKAKFGNARNAGVHLAFFSGNEVYWKTRWENNFRTLVCYKEGTLGENQCGSKCDTSSIWTGLWRSGEAYDAGQPENELSGNIGWAETNSSSITVPFNYRRLRFWRNTSIASLATGQTAILPPGSLGYEWDFENAQYADSYPSGRIVMSSTTLNGKTHKLSLYRHGSGALVFGAGTIQWAWGLDDMHDNGGGTASVSMQQATLNLFADMGVQPATRQANLVAASQSTDLTAPSATITSPTNGATFSSGAAITISGNATDAGGGVVAGVEVSVDGGNTWKVATTANPETTVSWTYSWVTTANGNFNIRVRGFDDSGNMGNPGTGINVTVGAVDNTPPTVISVSPVNAASGVSVFTNVSANFNEAISGASVTGSTFQLRNAANSLVTATLNTAGNQVTLTPSASLTASTTYTVTITGGASGVKDLAGNPLASNYSWSFTTSASSSTCPCTVFQPTNTPATPLDNDGQGIVVGMKFRTTQNGFITGVRYYKGSGTTGSHIGSLWTSTGSLLAQATFINETASGWQQVLFSTPVAVTAGVTYVVSNFSPSGDYAHNNTYFTQAVVNGPLRGLADGEDGPNGLYRYSSTSVFPNSSFNLSNYWVDVVFNTSGGSTSPTITTHPSSQTTCAGTNISFSSAAAGNPAPTVQWQESTNGTTWTNISGATNPTLNVAATTSLNGRQYRASWTNSGGTVNSNAATLTVNAAPAAPGVTVVNNCGNSVLTATGFTGSLLWNTGATTASITVNTAGTYTVTQTVSGCTSTPGTGTAAPKAIPAAPTVGVVNNCTNSVLTASGFTGTLLWSTGATTASITVSTAGTYTVTQTVNGCTSTARSATAAPKPVPPAPSVSVANNCGNSVLTATGFTGSLLWSTGATTASITVNTAGTYTVTQTVDGCTSTSGSGSAAPINSSVARPTVNVVNNCANSVLTASGFSGSLLWSTGATTASITVNTAGTYTVTQTVDGCTSSPASGVAAPKPVPVLSSSLTGTADSGSPFAYTATSTTPGTTFSWSRAAVSGISNTAATGTGNIAETLVNTTASAVSVTYIYTLTADSCSNTQNVVVTVNSPQTTVCNIDASITNGFNNTAIPAGRYIWFNSVLDRNSLTGITGTVDFYVTNSRITFSANNQQYTLNVPDAHISFDEAVTSATTQFVNNVWRTKVPRSYNNYVFMTGLPYQVPVNLPANVNDITWTADLESNKTGVSISWKWAAAVYTSFAAPAGLNIKPIGGSTQNPYPNSDKAGTPENFKASLVSGAKGNGGSNYTGNYTGTGNESCTAATGQRSATQTIQPLQPAQEILTRQLPAFNLDQFMTHKELDVQALPNPTFNFTNLVINGNTKDPVTIKVVDVFGRILERHENIIPGKTIRLGQKWKNGTYIAEVIQGDQRKVVKIIKAY